MSPAIPIAMIRIPTWIPTFANAEGLNQRDIGVQAIIPWESSSS
jgi:hypothetical protein